MIIDLPMWKPLGEDHCVRARTSLVVQLRIGCVRNTQEKGRQRQGFPGISVRLQYGKLTLRIPQFRFSVFFTCSGKLGCCTPFRWQEVGSVGLSWSSRVGELLNRGQKLVCRWSKNNELNTFSPGGGSDRGKKGKKKRKKEKKALIFFNSQRARDAAGWAGRPAAGGLTWCLCRLHTGPSEAPEWDLRGPSCWSCSTSYK